MPYAAQNSPSISQIYAQPSLHPVIPPTLLLPPQTPHINTSVGAPFPVAQVLWEGEAAVDRGPLAVGGDRCVPVVAVARDVRCGAVRDLFSRLWRLLAVRLKECPSW